MKKKIVFLLLAAALVAGGYFWRERGSATSGGDGLVLYGNVDLRDVNLGFRVPGRIAELYFEEGDRVSKGQVMAALEKDILEDEYNLACARTEEAQARAELAEKLYVRREGLVREGAVSQEVFDEALAARDEARAGMATASAQAALAKTRLEDARFVAPSDATVITRVREPGAIVAEGAAVYTLALDRPVWVRAYVSEPDLGHVWPGRRAEVLTDSGGSYHAVVGSVSTQAEFTPKNVETARLRSDLVFRVRVIVDSPDEGLRQGMPVTVKMTRGAPPPAAAKGD